ncbi:UNVERIFIED_CONTAM: hypothetical protein Scaly_1291600 [Sesamum calycinum]|uniref:Uncharacterized protein n=1 Tax=Sesamum calycinum TaxID=2727403 RepID=A0AAW2Q6D9_9LAMI
MDRIGILLFMTVTFDSGESNWLLYSVTGTVVEAPILSFYSLSYSTHAASHLHSFSVLEFGLPVMGIFLGHQNEIGNAMCMLYAGYRGCCDADDFIPGVRCNDNDLDL